MFTEHHQSHAASAFFASPFQRAAVLCLDGVGEWATTTAWLGEGNKLTAQWQIDFPHSLGLLYSAFTYYTGFKVNSGEYKLMGLAPYGEPKYIDKILDNLIDIKPDGTFRLNMEYFNYATGLTMTNEKFSQLFGAPPRQPEGQLTQREMDIASSIQWVTEEVVLRLANTVKTEMEVEHLCLAGGVALNCVANGRIVRECGYKDIWIQPAAGDAGGALGAALSIWHEYLEQPRHIPEVAQPRELVLATEATATSTLTAATPAAPARTACPNDTMRGSYLGPRFSDAEILEYLQAVKAPYLRLDDAELMPRLAQILADENVVGWFQGRMEFGPRALGGRSIIGDPAALKCSR